MSLKARLISYLAIIHLAGLALGVLYRETLSYWLFAVELGLLLSFLLGLKLIQTALQPLEFVKSFSDILQQKEFATRFSEMGQNELDRIISLYNQMLQELYQERLLTAEKRGFLESFIQATPLGVIILNYEHKISLINQSACHYLNATQTLLLGKTLNQVEHEIAQQLCAISPGQHRLFQWKGARRLRIERQQFIDRGFERDFLLIEELTALLDESERSAYEKLIRMMSHEVNNTIASTNSLLQSCLNYSTQIQIQDRGDFENALDVVINRNDRLNRFMQDFAQVVKLPQPKRTPINLDQLLAELKIIFRENFRQSEITCIRTGQRDLPKIMLDREQIEQALINIIKNAVEAIGQHGEIQIDTAKKPGEIQLRIIDNGRGLSENDKDQIFSPFFTSKTDGQGLGLTLVKEILLRHKFEFDLSTLEDQRTSFTISMPV